MPENRQEECPQKPLQFQQQNMNKSLISQLDLLASLRRDEYDICAIQEPYINFNGKTHANRQWTTIYLNTHKVHPGATRAVILVNANIPTDNWKQIHIQHPDIMAIEMTGDFGTLHILNIYNDCKNNSSLTHVSEYMRN